jgi:pimeloyl-ACP methyl ester carboxylesterase
MTELCCQFGEYGQLAGIVTEPAAECRSLCVLVNAGLVPKSGPWRLYVEAARRLAQSGVATLRFDLGGVGDSRREQADQPLKERTALEIRAAIDELRRRYPDSRGLVVGGLCSGAEDALRYAEGDARVTGVVLIAPFAYRTAGWKWRHIAFRVVRRTLRAAGVYKPMVPLHPPTGAGERKRVVHYQYMAHAESRRILRALIARQARLLFIYTGGQQDSFNHPGQLQQMFADVPFEGRVTVDFFAHMDHTQMFAADRSAVVKTIDGWIRP